MSIAETSARRSPHDLSHLIFSCGKIGRLQTLSAVPVLAGDSFEQNLVGSFRQSQLRRGLAVDSNVDIFSFYVPYRHIYGEQWIELMKEGIQSSPITDVDTYSAQYSGRVSFLSVNGQANNGRNQLPKWLFGSYQRIWNNYFKVPWDDDWTQTLAQFVSGAEDNQYGHKTAYLKNLWATRLPPQREGANELTIPANGSEATINLLDLNAQFGALHSEQERQLFMQRYRDVIKQQGGKTHYDADERPHLLMRSTFWASGYDVDGTDQATLGQFTGRVLQSFEHKVPRFFVPEHGVIMTLAVCRYPTMHVNEAHYMVCNPTIEYDVVSGDPAITANHPPVPVNGRDFFFNDIGDTAPDSFGEIAHSQWYRTHPPTIHTRFGFLEGFPFLDGFNPLNGDQALYVNTADYDNTFASEQLGHWNMQARNNVTVMRALPTARDAAMTNN